MKDKIQIDLGIGDPVEPVNRKIGLMSFQGRPLFEDAIHLMTYPLEAILAEKLESVISRGVSNTRMKDFHDLLLILRQDLLLDQFKARESIAKTCQSRNTLLAPIAFNEVELQVMQRMWDLYLRGLGDSADRLHLPQDMATVITEVNAGIANLAV